MPVNSTEYAATLVGAPTSILKPNQKHTRVLTSFATVTSGTGITQDDFVNLFTLPADSRVLYGTVHCDAQTGASFDIGTPSGTAAYCVGQSIASTTRFDLVQVQSGFGSEVTADTVVRLTVKGTNLVANKNIRAAITYACQ